MMLRFLALAPALALLVATPTLAEPTSVTAQLDVTLLGLPYASCDVTIPTNSTVGILLDAAVTSGCLDSWAAEEYEGFGRYVQCIDDVCGTDLTYWAFYVGDAYATKGIDTTIVADGGVYGFDYTQWAIPPLP